MLSTEQAVMSGSLFSFTGISYVRLVMMLTGSLWLEIFFRFRIEGPFAAEGAKVIGLALVLGFAGGGLGINVHATYRIFYHNEVLS